MKAVRTLPSWKRADSLFLCVFLTFSLLRSTTPLPSPSPRENFRSTAAETTKVYTYSSILVRGPNIHARSPKDFPT